MKSGRNLDGRPYRKVFDEWKQTKRNSYTDKVKVDRIVEYAGLYSLDYFGSIVLIGLLFKTFTNIGIGGRLTLRDANLRTIL